MNFLAASGYDLDGIVVQFCDNSPIIGSTTCTATAGTDVPNTSGVGVTVSAPAAGGVWSAAPSETSNTGVQLTNDATVNTVASGTQVTFTLTGLVNPSNNGTFYARIYTFDTATEAANYTVAAPGTQND